MCEVIQLFDGSYAVILGRGVVAYGIPFRTVAESIRDMCNDALEVKQCSTAMIAK